MRNKVSLGSGPGDCSQELWRDRSYLEAVLEFPADKVQSHGVDAGVEGGHVDPEIIHHQEETGVGRERTDVSGAHGGQREFPNCLAWDAVSMEEQ